MKETIATKEIIGYLKQNYQSTGFIDGLKIKYRCLICPFSALIEEVKPGEKVGDIGCGSGQFMLLIEHFAKPSEIFGIEISPRLVKNANNLFQGKGNGNFRFSTYDGTHFPEEISSMDVIFLVDVLHHVPSKLQPSFLKNIFLQMKSGSRLVLKDIDASSPLVFFNKCHDLIFAREIGHEISYSKAQNIIAENGLKILHKSKRTMYVYPHYTIVAQK